MFGFIIKKIKKYKIPGYALASTVEQTAVLGSVGDTVLNSFGTYEVVTDSRPTYNSVTQTISRKSTPELVSGVWTLKWEIKDKPQEDIDQEKADKQADIRSERVMELEQCDWTVLPDAPLSTDMLNKYKTFRQELRDITKQASFNNAEPSVTWPTKPS